MESEVPAGLPSAWIPAPSTALERPTSWDAPRQSSGVLGTAIYVTGSTNLVAGHRYAIAVRNGRLLILGPSDIDPERVALDRPVAFMEARAVEGRLILGNREGLVLAFMVGGRTGSQDLAEAITARVAGYVRVEG